MNSKEALKNICSKCEEEKWKNKIRCPFRSISSDYCEEYETIEKDLVILEILKNKVFDKLNCFDLDNGWYDDSFNLTDIEVKKIKEWLEDESH